MIDCPVCGKAFDRPVPLDMPHFDACCDDCDQKVIDTMISIGDSTGGGMASFDPSGYDQKVLRFLIAEGMLECSAPSSN